MPRVISGSQSQSYLVNVVSTPVAETMQLRASSPPDISSSTTNGSSLAARSRTPLSRKPSLKSTSFHIPRVDPGPVDAEHILGNKYLTDSTPNPPRRIKYATPYKAAEKGKGDLLPVTSRSLTPPNRARSVSSSTLSLWANARLPTRGEAYSARTLRSRGRRDSNSSNESATNNNNNNNNNNHNNRALPSDWSYSGSHDKPPSYFDKVSLMKRGNTNFIQMVVVLVISCLVWESYRRALMTTEHFEKLKHDEGLVLMHLQKVEQTSLHLHELMARISDGTIRTNTAGQNSNDGGGGSGEQGSDVAPVDAELIRVQTQQLLQMEEELQHELRGLRNKLQQVARTNIVKSYGEGPLQITFDLDFGELLESPERISISLGYDTPYAAWTIFEQIQKGQWIGARFTLDKGLSITAIPANPDPTVRLDFIELSHEKHEAWTVGLKENDGITLFINLQDNSDLHKHEVCIGKVIEGFGSLQKLVASTRRLDGTDRAVTIKSAIVSKLSRGKSTGIFE